MPSSSNASVTRVLEEVTPGTIESGGPQILRVVDGGLVQTTTASEDNELRSDRGKGDSVLVSGEVAGDININWSHSTYDDFLEALLADEYIEAGANGITDLNDAEFDSTAHTLVSAGAELPVIAPNQWFQISSANTSANNGLYKSTSATHTTSLITVDTAVQDFTTDTANTASISSSRVSQGNDTLRTFTVERELTDITPQQFFTWAGCYISTLNLSYTVGEKLTGAFGLMGTETEDQGTASNFSGIGSEVAAGVEAFFNTVTNTHVLLDGVAVGDSCLESLSLTVDAQLRGRRCIGSGLAFSSVGSDPFNISFTTSMFFGTTASAALYQKKLDDATMSLSICLQDADGNGFAITIPRASLSEATVVVGGMSSDVLMNITGSVSTDPTSGSMIHFDRLGTIA